MRQSIRAFGGTQQDKLASLCRTEKMTASEAFVETLAAQGVTDVFGIVGSAFMDALDLFPDAGKFLSKKAKNLFFPSPGTTPLREK